MIPLDQLDRQTKTDLTTYLAQFVTAHKQQRIREVLAQRTRCLTLVLEDIYQPHNASAVLRSCECLGIQDVHAIEQRNRFNPNKNIVHGAAQWLSIHRYRRKSGGTSGCLTHLRQQGYHIAAMTLRPGSIPIAALHLDQPIALCIGTEGDGLSETAHALADSFVQIPMVGFTQSFNLSVTAAIALYDLSQRLRHTPHWPLNAQEKQDLTLEWYARIIEGGPTIIRNYLQQHPPSQPE